MSRITSQFAMPAALLGLTLALGAPLAAQTAPQTPAQAQAALENGVAPTSVPGPAQPVASGAGECPPTAAKAEPATPQQGGAGDGTAPENTGSTGWTGGTGGSQIGTNPSGATHATKTWHAPTARGLDLNGRPEPAPAC